MSSSPSVGSELLTIRWALTTQDITAPVGAGGLPGVWAGAGTESVQAWKGLADVGQLNVGMNAVA